MADMTFNLLLLVAGLALIWWSSDRSVRYAMESSRLLGLSGFAVGFVILSVSTGLPEAVTAIVSVFADAPDLSVGNIFGSNIVNITLILGLTVLLTGEISVERHLEGSLLKLMLFLGIIVGLFMFLPEIGLISGLILCLIYAVVVYGLKDSSVMKEVVGQEQYEAEEELEQETFPNAVFTLGRLFISIIFVLISAHIVVRSSTGIASTLGISNSLIWSTIVALGTGLPELSLELNAVKRKEYGLALGNIFGSILVNLTLVLGTLSIISPAALNLQNFVPLQIFFLAATAIVYIFVWTRHKVTRKEAGILVLLFLFYILYQVEILTVI